MSYSAFGEGHITLKKETPMSLIKELGKVFSYVSCSKKETSLELGVWQNNDEDEGDFPAHFDHGNAEEALEQLEAYTVGGYIEMHGEDDLVWRYRFDVQYGKWASEGRHEVWQKYRKDENGNVIYGPPLWAVVRSVSQGDYTEPRYYASAQDAQEIICIKPTQYAAEQEAERLNRENENEVRDDDEDYTEYKVVETYLDV